MLKKFRTLSMILTKLVVNEGCYIYEDNIRQLLLIGEKYSEISHRTFKVVGQYPIALSTLGPVSREKSVVVIQTCDQNTHLTVITAPHKYIVFMVTCIIFLSRFLY